MPIIIGTLIIFSSVALFQIKDNKVSKESESSYISVVREVTGSKDVETVQIDKNGSTYYKVHGNEYYIDSLVFSSNVTGYGGPILTGFHIDSRGVLKNIEVLKHYETGSWMRKSMPWIKSLIGLNIFSEDELLEVDTLTGATYTTGAIKESLLLTGKGLNGILLDRSSNKNKEVKEFSFVPEVLFIVSIVLTVIALIIRKNPSAKIRRIFMAVLVLICFFIFNIQFSTYNIVSILSLKISVSGLTLPLFFYIILPVTILMWGNYYCGYLCPFGLLQELIGDISPLSAVNPNKKLINIKYLFLFLIITSRLLFNSEIFLNMDILRGLFLFTFKTGVALAVILIINLRIKRFWCRFLCPTGAFLNILNWISIKSFKLFLHRFKFIRVLHIIPRPKKCDLGIESVKDINCFNCDRCKN